MATVKHRNLLAITPRPKVDPLRPFPADLARTVERVRVPVGDTKTVTLPLHEGAWEDVIVEVGAGATLTLMLRGDCRAGAYAKSVVEIRAERDSRVRWVVDVSGGRRLEIEANVQLVGPSAEVEVFGAFHGRNEQHQGFHIVMDHQVEQTKGNIRLKGVYEDRSRGLFTALIKVQPQAQQTNSYFRDDVLLLDEAIAESLPTLEIEANDVRASHGSTTSRLNDDQLFYLMTRGLTPEQARQLIVQGFLHTVTDRISPI